MPYWKLEGQWDRFCKGWLKRAVRAIEGKQAEDGVREVSLVKERMKRSINRVEKMLRVIGSSEGMKI